MALNLSLCFVPEHLLGLRLYGTFENSGFNKCPDWLSPVVLEFPSMYTWKQVQVDKMFEYLLLFMFPMASHGVQLI